MAKGINYVDVFWFVPNLIGYSRVLLSGVAAYSMYYEHPSVMFISYALSELLDAADGYYARKLGQCSKFGEVLDMVTDRCTTTVLLTYLAHLYPSLALLFCGWYYLSVAFTVAAFPIFVIKNVINVVQLYESAKDLAKLDAAQINRDSSPATAATSAKKSRSKI
ncbi:phosphatidylinositol synthase 1 (CDP-alcohol phosphatidyltransferase1) [Coemansia sp. S146]|nr:phosphatidylinositol synthase 1 (CDP-alcohol phosphatidyltransferase1) [Coemansia sp. S146]